jgi:hypothetical protein
MQRSAGNTECPTDGDRTQFRDSLDGSGHEVLPSLSTAAIGIPHNSETFFERP